MKMSMNSENNDSISCICIVYNDSISRMSIVFYPHGDLPQGFSSSLPSTQSSSSSQR